MYGGGGKVRASNEGMQRDGETLTKYWARAKNIYIREILLIIDAINEKKKTPMFRKEKTQYFYRFFSWLIDAESLL